MTTATIDDALATRLRALRDTDGDFNALVADALAETVGLWEQEALGRAETERVIAQVTPDVRKRRNARASYELCPGPE